MTVLLHVNSLSHWVVRQKNTVCGRLSLLELQDLGTSRWLDRLLASNLGYFFQSLDAVSFEGTWLHVCEVLIVVEGMASEDLLGEQVVVLLLPLLYCPDAALAVVIAGSLGVVTVIIT